MIETILVATDGSEAAASAERFGIALGTRLRARLSGCAVVEDRDVKGWYKKARTGEVKEFTGVSDPYEPPLDPEMTLLTTDTTPVSNAQLVVEYLQTRGILTPA